MSWAHFGVQLFCFLMLPAGLGLCMQPVQFPCLVLSGGFLALQFQFPVNPVPGCLELAQERGHAGQGSVPVQGYGPVWICSNRNQGAALPWQSFQLGQCLLLLLLVALPEGNHS